MKLNDGPDSGMKASRSAGRGCPTYARLARDAGAVRQPVAVSYERGRRLIDQEGVWMRGPRLDITARALKARGLSAGFGPRPITISALAS